MFGELDVDVFMGTRYLSFHHNLQYLKAKFKMPIIS